MNPLLILLSSVVSPDTDLQNSRWGWDAHKMVCEIAYRRLTPAGKEMVDGIMALDTIPTFAEACLWSDAVKYSTHPTTRAYHYVNIPPGQGGYDAERDCSDRAQRCVVWAIPQYVGLLAADTPVHIKLEALKMVGHFIGDLHQPLHAGRPGDLGGNTINVEFPDADGTGFLNYNLHQIWDRRMLERVGITWPESVAALVADIDADDAARWEDFDVIGWTNEANQTTETIVYDFPEDGRITEEYIERAVEYSLVAIQRAGVRLAYVLNSIADGELTAATF